MLQLFASRFRVKNLILIFFFMEVFSLPLLANPGDTTWVTVFDKRKLTYHGNYDTIAVFPVNKRYRKIRMHYILGRYACPPPTTPPPHYCGSWDYTTQIYARRFGKDSVEIARVITPYASDWFSKNKQHDYVVDVTDYASVLDSITGMRFRYDGYSWGFTITLKIEFIEGVPPMDAIAVKNIYDGYYPYGNAGNSIENYLTPKTFTYGPSTPNVFIKNSVSGHGADNQGCGEFCSKYYELKIDNNTIAQKQLWRNDCGVNHVYPQTGTWIYDRANWCPGAVVWPIYHNISSITNPNTTFTVNVDMQPYFNANPSGGYNWVSQLVHYSAPNHATDVSIEEIIAPNTNENFFRNNPTCNSPIIRVKNTGTDTLKTIAFSYGLKNGPTLTYTWSGSMAFLEENDIVFPQSASILSGSLSAVFQVSVVSVNELNGDQNQYNNFYQSTTKPVLTFPKDFVVKMTSNIQGYDNSWELFDEYDNVVASRTNVTASTNYIDSVLNLIPGCYRFAVYDASCDGMSWWANTAQGTGALRIDIPGGNPIFHFPGDFGCNYMMYFVVLPPIDTTSVAENYLKDAVSVYPNPARTLAYIRLDVAYSQQISYKISDIAGKVVFEKSVYKNAGSNEVIDASGFASGVYMVSVQLENGYTLTRKLVVTK